jgi:hypothetical protein
MFNIMRERTGLRGGPSWLIKIACYILPESVKPSFLSLMSKLFKLVGSQGSGPAIDIFCRVVLHIKNRFSDQGNISFLLVLKKMGVVPFFGILLVL